MSDRRLFDHDESTGLTAATAAPDRQKSACRAWYVANRDRVTAEKRAKYAANPEKYRAEAVEYRRKHPGRVRATKAKIHKRYPERERNRALRRYGLTLQGFRVMLGQQEGLCRICRVVLRGGLQTQVDHCHTTGTVRGLLCNNCNTAIAGLRDSSETALDAAAYLRFWAGK